MKQINQSSKKILITFARSFLSLELARLLSASGHQILVADSMRYQISRFSNAVSKCFKIPSPRFNPGEYIDALRHIVEEEGVDLLIPIYEEITYLAQAKHLFPSFCEIFCPSFDSYNELYNKWLFQVKLEKLGILHPKTLLIRNKEDMGRLKITRPIALKACYSRASQEVKKVYPGEPFPKFDPEKHNPWVVQEWLEGKRFCTYTICHSGTIFAHSAYPVKYAINGHSCITFESIEHQRIFDWVAHFVKLINYTGQIAFDFIESQDNQLYPIECNPRATNGILLFDKSEEIDQAFMGKNSTPIFPKTGRRKQIATGMMLYGWRKESFPNNCFSQFIKDLIRTPDAVFRVNDLKPFLFEILSIANIYSNSKKYRVNIPAAFTFDHDWNGEETPLEEKLAISTPGNTLQGYYQG